MAEHEMGVLDQTQRQRVEGEVGDEVVPQPLGGERAPGRPRLGRREMAALALRRAANRRFGRGQRPGHFGMVAAKAADQEQIGDRDRAEREAGVGRQRALQPADRIAAQPPIVGDGAVERRRRGGRAGERQALLVFRHDRIPIARTAGDDDSKAAPAGKRARAPTPPKR